MSTPPRVVNLWPDDCEHNGDGSDRPRMEIYQPADRPDSPIPVMVVCPGGGYEQRAPHEAAPFAEFFNQHGMVGVVSHYRVSPNRYPAPFTDLARTIRLTRAMAGELRIDPDRLGLIGFSAGGHNSCTVGTQPNMHHDPHDDLVDRYSARPDRLVLAYPVISLLNHAHTGSGKNLLGVNPTDVMLKKLSGELHVDADTPPTFLFHTADDAVVSVENSLRYASACRAAGVPFALHVYPHGHHGVGLARDMPAVRSWTKLMIDWLGDFGD